MIPFYRKIAGKTKYDRETNENIRQAPGDQESVSFFIKKKLVHVVR